MVATIVSDGLVVGLVAGFTLGLICGPLLRSWLAWREAADAAREADLLEEVLARLDAADRTAQAPRAGAPQGAGAR